MCANIYPHILKWACGRKADGEVEKCWEAFSVLKGRIVSHTDSDNEGYDGLLTGYISSDAVVMLILFRIRTMTFKFLEAVILSQSLKTDVGGYFRFLFSLTTIVCFRTVTPVEVTTLCHSMMCLVIIGSYRIVNCSQKLR